MQISKWYPKETEIARVWIRLQYLQNERAQDTWFLLLISVIVAHLRLVGESAQIKSLT
jgi:hypothetical protein